MAWRRPGDKPLSGPMMVKLPTHICVTRPQWVKIERPRGWISIKFCWTFSILKVAFRIGHHKRTPTLQAWKDVLPTNLKIQNSRSWGWVLKLMFDLNIWRACQISGRSGNSKHKIRGVESWRNFTTSTMSFTKVKQPLVWFSSIYPYVSENRQRWSGYETWACHWVILFPFHKSSHGIIIKKIRLAAKRHP